MNHDQSDTNHAQPATNHAQSNFSPTLTMISLILILRYAILCVVGLTPCKGRHVHFDLRRVAVELPWKHRHLVSIWRSLPCMPAAGTCMGAETRCWSSVQRPTRAGHDDEQCTWGTSSCLRHCIEWGGAFEARTSQTQNKERFYESERSITTPMACW